MNHIDIDMHRALSELDDPRYGIALKRNTAIDLVTALIDFLDDTEGDPDLEDNDPDLEPSLGGGEVNCQVDLELDDCDAEDIDPDLEPALGAPEIPPTYMQRGGLYGWYSAHGSQEHWASGDGHMDEETAEAEDAGGGDIQDVPHDGDLDLREGDNNADLEPSLGSPEIGPAAQYLYADRRGVLSVFRFDGSQERWANGTGNMEEEAVNEDGEEFGA